jgi:hypothetical protein
MSLAASRSISKSGFWLAALIAAAVAAFWKPYLMRIGAGVDVVTHVHAGTMTGWLLLLAGQALLVRYRQPAAHRAMGQISYALMPAVLIGATALAVQRLRMTRADLSADHAELFFVQLGTTALLAIFYAMAMVHRRDPPVHARFMIGTGLTMIDPIVARLLIHLAPSWGFLAAYVVWLVAVPVLVLLIAREPPGRRARTPYVQQLVLFVLYQAAVPIVGRSATWRVVVEWVAG